MNLTHTIQATINNRKEPWDKNGNQYLILELDNGESIFVFPGKVPAERWTWLKAGQSATFTVAAGKNGANLLVDYEIEV